MFIFVMPSIQGMVDCMVFFESKIVNRYKANRNRDNVDNRIREEEMGRNRGQEEGSMERYRDRDGDKDFSSSAYASSPSTKSVSRNPMFRERHSDFVFENFAVPVGNVVYSVYNSYYMLYLRMCL